MLGCCPAFLAVERPRKLLEGEEGGKVIFDFRSSQSWSTAEKLKQELDLPSSEIESIHFT